MLVKIGNTDITQNVIAESYEVNDERPFEEWKDADKKRHRDYERHIVGKFDLKFTTESDYNSFLNLMKNNTRDDIISMTLYVVNSGKEETINAFFDFKPVVMKNNHNKRIAKFTFNIEEQ